MADLEAQAKRLRIVATEARQRAREARREREKGRKRAQGETTAKREREKHDERQEPEKSKKRIGKKGTMQQRTQKQKRVDRGRAKTQAENAVATMEPGQPSGNARAVRLPEVRLS